jgi:prepilin-type processing-associated H-X9-DG protein
MGYLTAGFPPAWRNARWHYRALSIAAILAIMIPEGAAQAQQVRPATPVAGASIPSLATFVPRQDLIIYLEYQGLDAHSGAWHKTAAYRLVSETKVGTLLEDMAIQAIDLYQEVFPATVRVKGVDGVEIAKRIARNGFVIGVFGKPQERWRYLIVLRQCDRPEIRALLQSLANSERGDRAGDARTGSIEKAGSTLRRFGSGHVWWFEKGDLILTEESEIDEILEVIHGRRPSAIDHPLRAELFKAEAAFGAVAAGFLDSGALLPLAKETVQLGLSGVKRLELRWGFDQDALVGVLRAVAPAPRAGALALLDQPAFGIGTLPAIPEKVSGLTVMSIDLAKSYDMIDSLIKQVGSPKSAGLSNPVVLRQQGVDLRKDLLANLGTKLAFYTQSPPHHEPGSAGELAASRAAGSTFSVQLRDQDRVARVIDPLARSFGPFMRQRFRLGARDRLSLFVASLNLTRMPGRNPHYVLDWPPNTLPAAYSSLLRPQIVVGKDRLVLAASNMAVTGALETGARWQPAQAFVPIVRQLPAEMIYLRLADPRAATPVLLAGLPVLVRQINAEIAMKERLAGKAAKDVYLRLDAETVPTIDEVNGRLFPSSTTVTVDSLGAVLTHREAIPTISSPAVTGAILAQLLPVIRASIEASRRAQCVNNIKQIALAMHNYHSANNAFPRAASIDENGKPLLSWRVMILPYLGHQDLYNRFNLDEPWDSAHNKVLLKEMPPVYACRDRVKPEPFTTTYEVLVGKNTMFEKDRDIGVQDVTDGTSNTFLVVEARNAVPWTKPDDLAFDPGAAASLCGAGSSHPGGFNAAMGDGSVHFIRDTIDVKKFRSMITRNLGEVVIPGDF